MDTSAPSTSSEYTSRNAKNSSDCEPASDVSESESSDSDSSSGNSASCPICLLKFKGQCIGCPQVCGHPFCLDCILEWSKNVRTCPIDRIEYSEVFVRLELDGVVVRKIPVVSSNDAVEEDVLDVTQCQVCGSSEREDELLLCDRCDHGYHLDCLSPPLAEVPVEDWFCPQCDGSQASALVNARRAPLTVRVRRAVQRNRQRVLKESGKRKTKKRQRTKGRVRGKGRRKMNRSRKKADSVPTPRERLAQALGLQDKPSYSGMLDTSSSFSLLGNPNSLDFVENDREEQVMTCNETSRPKSLIAILAERRKVQKSIYSFAPNTIPSVPTRTSKPNISSSGGSVDILGDILASQTQLKCFGKPESLLNPPVRSVTSRVLSAILASKDTLSRLDRDLEQFTKGVNNGADSATPNSQKQQCASGGGSKSNQLPASNTRQVAESGTPVNNGASNGGDDPDGNRRKRKSEPEDKPEEADEEESVEEESESMENSIKAQVNQEDDKMLDEDDEKGLIIDDSRAEELSTIEQPPEAGTTPSTDDSSPTAIHKELEAKPGSSLNTGDSSPVTVPTKSSGVGDAVLEEEEEEEVVAPLSAPVVRQPQKCQHGGLPAVAAALSFASRNETRPRPTQDRNPSSNSSVMNNLMKANLVSSIASALKQTLTTALLEQTKHDSLAPDLDDVPLPVPSYSDTKDSQAEEERPTADSKNPPDTVAADETNSPAIPAVAAAPTTATATAAPITATATVGHKKSPRRKRKLEEIFGSDDDDVEDVKSSNNLEQISDCEEGELDESDGVSEPDLPASGNRIVRMLTPPVVPRGSNDCEEGEIVDKKSLKKKRKKKLVAEETVPPDCDLLESVGIGGERKVELSSVDEAIPSTFKKPSDSSKTRHYRHQGDVKKVAENYSRSAEVKAKKEDDPADSEDKRSSSKRQEMKRYDVRRVVEKRSRDRHSTGSDSRSGRHRRSRSPGKSKSSRSRKRSSSTSLSSSSSDSSRSSSPATGSKRRKGKENQRKRSESPRSQSESDVRKRRKHKMKDRAEDKVKDKKKKKHKEKKKKHKEKKDYADALERPADSGASATGRDDIEIPSKAVFASGDKIVVSLHFGSSGSKSITKKKKRKSEMTESKSEAKPEATKRVKEDAEETREGKSEAPPTLKKTSSVAEEAIREETSVAPAPGKTAPVESCAQLPQSAGPRREEAPRGDGSRSLRGRGGRRMPHPSRLHKRVKPVLIDIETSKEIPLETRPASDVIILSDSDASDKETSAKLPSIPLPPLPPLPLLPSAPKIGNKAPSKAKGPLAKPTNVKFSLTSKPTPLKKVNNPLFGEDEEDDTNEESQAEVSVPASDTQSQEEDYGLPYIPLPDQPPPPSSNGVRNTESASPIFRPATPPVSAYDPSHPTHTPSTSSTPSLPASPVPPIPPPPNPPPPMVTSFPLPHPGAVLIPPMTSLPPPPLPPPPLLAAPFGVNPPTLLQPGVYHHHPSYPPPILPSGMAPPGSSAAAALTTCSSPLKSSVSGSLSTPIPSKPSTSRPPGNNSTVTPSKSAGRPMTPPSPTPSEGSDIFGPPSVSPSSPVPSSPSPTFKPHPPHSSGTSGSHPPKKQNNFDSLMQSSSVPPQHRHSKSSSKSKPTTGSKLASGSKPPVSGKPKPTGPPAPVSSTNDGNEECPSSAVELLVKEKFLKKLNRQERVVEEVRLALKPYYTTKKISKADYKEILRKCVPKICHTKSGEINPMKIKEMVKGYVKKFRYLKKKVGPP